MNIKQAITYPFRKENFVSVIIMPVILNLVASVAMVLPILAFGASLIPSIMALAASKMSADLDVSQLNGMYTSPVEGAPPMPYPMPPMDTVPVIDQSMLITFAGALLGGLVLFYLITLPVMGYGWRLIDHWQTKGLDAPAPGWKGSFKEYYKGGFQMFVANWILMVPMVLAMIPLGLLVPFMMAPYFLAAGERTSKSVMANMPAGFKLVGKRFVPIIIGFYLCIVLSMVYGVIAGLASFTIVGSPIIAMASLITCMHLMTQQFDIHQSEMPAASKHSHKPAMQTPAKPMTQMASPSGADPTMSAPQEGQEEGGEAMMVYMNPNQLPTKVTKSAVSHFNHLKGENPWLKHQHEDEGQN